MPAAVVVIAVAATVTATEGVVLGVVAATAAAIAMSHKPFVKLEKVGVGAVGGFIASGGNPIGAVVGGALSAFTGGRPLGAGNIAISTAGGGITGAVAGGVLGAGAQSYAGHSVLGSSMSTALGKEATTIGTNLISQAVTQGQIDQNKISITQSQFEPYPSTYYYHQAVVYTPMGNTTFSGNLFQAPGLR